MYSQLIKPVCDFIFAVVIILLAAPLWLTITIILLFEHRGKVLFIQQRSKIRGESFYIFKFRSLHQNGQPSRFGNFLRATSLDELPQCLNILKGEMSFIGPRPLYTSYNSKYSKEQAKRLCVKPGITGLAQINGENRLSWNQKFIFDSAYVETISLKTDFKIFLKTIHYLFSKVDLHSKHHLGTEEFKG